MTWYQVFEIQIALGHLRRLTFINLKFQDKEIFLFQFQNNSQSMKNKIVLLGLVACVSFCSEYFNQMSIGLF